MQARLPRRTGCDEPEKLPTGRDEILVRVQACGLNHGDHALNAAVMSQPFTPAAPYISGMDAAGTVIAAGDGVTRFHVGDDVFGHFQAESWALVPTPCARTTADGPHVERRPEGLDPLAAAALAEGGLIAKTILRAADIQPGHTALVIGATTRTGTVLIPLLAEAGAHVIAAATPADEDHVRALGASQTTPYSATDPLADALASHPDIDLFVDLITFGEPYFITATAGNGTIVTDLPVTYKPGIPRIAIAPEPGDLATLAQRALDGHQPVDLAHVYRLE
jgi:NADPH2:quinone reductase